MPSLGGFDPALATALILALNGVVPMPRAAVCIPAGAALGWAAVGPAMLGTAVGSALGFGLARFALRGTVERLASRHSAVTAVMRAIDQEGWRCLALLRFGSPVPGPAINAACGVTRMGFGTFMAIGLAAVLPQTLLFVYLGVAGARALAHPSLLSLDTLTALAGLALTLLAFRRIRAAARRQSARIVADGGVSAG